jgi:hypothetical protein
MNDLSKGRPVLSIDFDGVIHSYASGWKGADIIPDEPVPGALDFLAEATKHFDVCIFSSRTHQKGGMIAMQDWLWRNVAGHFKSIPDWIFKIQWPENKPAAFLSIDDRGFQFNGTFPDPKSLLDFKPWNKK